MLFYNNCFCSIFVLIFSFNDLTKEIKPSSSKAIIALMFYTVGTPLGYFYNFEFSF